MFPKVSRLRSRISKLVTGDTPVPDLKPCLHAGDLTWLGDGDQSAHDANGKLRSCLCTQALLESPEFVRWIMRLEPHALDESGQVRLHRKLWEYGFIVQALYERDLLRTGSMGLGFAVGRDPLPAYMASQGCPILATDLYAAQSVRLGWSPDNQHPSGLAALNDRGLCSPKDFQRLVKFRPVDMNALPGDLQGFDFCWSACAIEHLGSIRQGLRFFERMLDTLRPGGVGVHTTEFNLLSNDATVDHQPTVLFRKRDFDELAQRLTRQSHHVDLVYQAGNTAADLTVDLPPYRQDPHLKLGLMNFTTTSIGLIITKG